LNPRQLAVKLTRLKTARKRRIRASDDLGDGRQAVVRHQDVAWLVEPDLASW
jgi:hypothetical protein